MTEKPLKVLDEWEEIIGELKEINVEEEYVVIAANYDVKLPEEILRKMIDEKDRKISILRTDKKYYFRKL